LVVCLLDYYHWSCISFGGNLIVQKIRHISERCKHYICHEHKSYCAWSFVINLYMLMETWVDLRIAFISPLQSKKKHPQMFSWERIHVLSVLLIVEEM